MTIFQRISLLTIGIFLTSLVLRSEDVDNKPWPEIRAIANTYVTHESPNHVFPFAMQDWDSLRVKPKKVFAHFFVPFPASFDNKIAAEDHYATYLSPEKSDAALGKQSFYKKGSGGYIRQRPLPHGPWDSSYWQEINYAIQILRAQKIGLDGFAVDILQTAPGRPQYDRAELLLEVASNVAPGFSIMLMPDAAAAFRRIDVEKATRAIDHLAKYPAAYRLGDGRLVVAPFYANNREPEFWKQVLEQLDALGHKSTLFPVFLFFEKLDENASDFAPISYGLSDWGFRDIESAKAYEFFAGPSIAAKYAEHWMMPVSPQDLRPKDLVMYEAGNTSLYRELWQAAMDTETDYVQLITWDDYSESTEIAPSSKTQFLFYDLTAYYTQWFKDGVAPKITEDALYYSHREHLLPFSRVDIKQQRENFSVGGKTPLRNEVELLAMLTAPATLEIVQGDLVSRKGAQSGLVQLSVPARVGQPVFRIVRDGAVVLEVKSHWTITDQGPVENPIYCGGSSTRDFVSITTPEEPTSSWGPYLPDEMDWSEKVKAKQRMAGEKLLKSIKASYSAGEREIIVPKGHYRFRDTHGNKEQPYHIGISNMQNLTIDFQGSHLWFETESSGLRLAGCHNVTIKNAFLDWDPLPYIQGRIRDIDTDRNTFTVTIDAGYASNRDEAIGGLQNDGYWRGCVFDQKNQKMKANVVSFGTSFSWKHLADDGSIELPFWGFHQTRIGESGVEVGDPIVLFDRMGRAVRIEGCANTVLENITLYSSPFIGFVENTGLGNTHYLRCNIVRKPNTNRLIAGNADGFNISNVELGPTIEDCRIEQIGDDFVNIHNDFARVLEQNSPDIVVTSRLCYRNEISEPVEVEFFERETMRPLGTRFATVQVVRNYKIEKKSCMANLEHKWHSGEAAGLSYGKTMWAVHQLKLDEPLELKGDVIVNCKNFMSAGGIIRDCDFQGSLARGIRLQAPSTTIVGNRISNTHSVGISMGSHANYWGEGSYASHSAILNNRIESTCEGLGASPNRAAILVRLGGDIEDYKIQEDISIIGNRIDDSNGAGIIIYGVEGLKLENNTISGYVLEGISESRHSDPIIAQVESRLASAGIGGAWIRGLVRAGNTVVDPGENATDEILLTEVSGINEEPSHN